MIVLDLCGGSGNWGRPYLDGGYDVINVTLPDHDVRTYTPPPNVHGILAAPPCERFSLAYHPRVPGYATSEKRDAARRKGFAQGLITVRACLDIIWKCEIERPLAFWAMENPRGNLRKFLGAPAFSFKQWEFGDMGVKPTDLWGRFSLPVKTVSDRPADCIIQPWAGRKPAVRALTPPGFAQAFFLANP